MDFTKIRRIPSTVPLLKPTWPEEVAGGPGLNFGWQVNLQYIPRNMHTVFALLCFVVVIHWLIFPYPSGLLHWHCGNLTIAPVPAKQPWWIWISTSCEFIINDCITTTKQSTTKPCAYFLGYTVTCTHEYQHQVNPEQETQDEVVLRLPGTNPSNYSNAKELRSKHWGLYNMAENLLKIF